MLLLRAAGHQHQHALICSSWLWQQPFFVFLCCTSGCVLLLLLVLARDWRRLCHLPQFPDARQDSGFSVANNLHFPATVHSCTIIMLIIILTFLVRIHFLVHAAGLLLHSFHFNVSLLFFTKLVLGCLLLSWWYTCGSSLTYWSQPLILSSQCVTSLERPLTTSSMQLLKSSSVWA